MMATTRSVFARSTLSIVHVIQLASFTLSLATSSRILVV